MIFLANQLTDRQKLTLNHTKLLHLTTARTLTTTTTKYTDSTSWHQMTTPTCATKDADVLGGRGTVFISPPPQSALYKLAWTSKEQMVGSTLSELQSLPVKQWKSLRSCRWNDTMTFTGYETFMRMSHSKFEQDLLHHLHYCYRKYLNIIHTLV